MIITKNLLADSTDTYRSIVNWAQNSMINGHDYEVDLDLTTQNLQGGEGMTINQTNAFYIDYPTMRMLSKARITQNYDTSGVLLEWSGIYMNPATLSGSYEYVDNFIRMNNTALDLNSGATLSYYSSTIPTGFTLSFLDKISRQKNGLIFETSDGQYLFGYNNSMQKFYTTIQGITNYSEVIKISDNPFMFFIESQQVVIRQYNIYRKMSKCKDIPISSIDGMPLAFMAQTNN